MSIGNISDTARWVALYRAWESERPDALFHDPYARKLAGPDAEELVAAVPGGTRMAWAMVVRTQLLDEMILRAVHRDGFDTVVNLAAGLDARPFRMALPSTLRWVDVDLPGISRYKREQLAGERAACRYESEEVDLADVDARRSLFTRINVKAERALVISEGLLVYLPAADVAALAADLHDQPCFLRWLTDLAGPRLLGMLHKQMGGHLAKGGVRMQFAPEEGPRFFQPFGWRLAELRSTMDEARRLRREMPLAWLWRGLGRLYPAKVREELRTMSAIVALERT
ncbi:MAG TPA: class I SAM-dependent methyltransferase [Longimicrobiaceae bacterium]|jgi:methyltransferase (TIGR00027 family)|nr:class I SAM-dependent methyltransferase [Longimicrobiaceae bacterium]